MKISVVGTGYVGLVSGVCLAEKGHNVVCVDIDPEKVDMVNKGVSPIHEKGLTDLLTKNIKHNLLATTDLDQAVEDTDISIIAVGTPFDGRHIDLSYIKVVAQKIGAALKNKDGYHLVVVKSTVVPGTTDGVVLPLLEKASGKKAGPGFGVGMNPEFLREGEAVQDFMFPDRIVMGGIDSQSIDLLEALYRPFKGVDKIRTNNKTAEMIKYTSNSLLATMISFSNEIANLCTAIGDIDVKEVMAGIHLDKRLSPILPDGSRITPSFTTYIEAGCGFGGSCFPKDVKALISHGQNAGVPMSLLESVIQINLQQPFQVLPLLQKHFPSFEGVKVSVLGLAFKPGTDDMRESPAIPIVSALLEQRALVKAYDPIAQKQAESLFANTALVFSETIEDAINDADAIVLLTGWAEFHALPALIADLDPPPLMVDGRRMLDKNLFDRYEGIGLSQLIQREAKPA